MSNLGPEVGVPGMLEAVDEASWEVRPGVLLEKEEFEPRITLVFWLEHGMLFLLWGQRVYQSGRPDS